METRAAEQKERARQQRRDAYQKLKAQRAVDPKYLAQKEAMRERQRAAYRAAKEKRKAAEATTKAQTVDDKITEAQESLLRLCTTRGIA